jgi:hypothetical protein
VHMINAEIIGMAAPWAISALVLTAVIVLLPVALVPSKSLLAALRTNIFATTPVIVAAFAALAARSAAVASEGASVGAVIGAGALVGTAVGLAVLGGTAGSTPAIQELVRASEPHPEARLPHRWIAPMGTATGAFSGLMLGAMNLLLAILVGFLVGR